jgi:hypothetical protein
VHFNDLVLSERTLVGVLGYVDDSPCAIALLADGRINADPLITSRVALDDAIEDGFRELVRNKDEHVKILINPSGVGSKPSTRAAAEPAVKVQQQLTSAGFDRRAPEPRHAIEPGRAQRRAREPRRSARSSTSRELLQAFAGRPDRVTYESGPAFNNAGVWKTFIYHFPSHGLTEYTFNQFPDGHLVPRIPHGPRGALRRRRTTQSRCTALRMT